MGKLKLNGNYLIMLWAGAVVVAFLWRSTPWTAVVLMTLTGVVGIAVVRARHHRLAQGYWVEYISPARLRADEHEFAIVYHEDKESIFFEGREQARPEQDHLSIPSAAAWDSRTPLWAQGRREIITQRLLADKIVQRCKIVEGDKGNAPGTMARKIGDGSDF